jgi:hypothetical protein
MGGYVGYKETGKDRFNTGAFEARQTRLAELVGHRDVINIKARELGSPFGAINQVETFNQRQAQVKEQAFRVKLNRAERERIIAAIKARQSILRIGAAEQMDINRAEQVAVAQQIRHEAKEIAQDIPFEMALGPVLALLALILKKLPEKAYEYLSATMILSMALSVACSAINHQDIEVSQADPAAETALLPDSASDDGAAIEVSPTAAVTETAPVVDLVEDLYNRYFAGESIDISNLSEDEWVELSAKLAEKKNADRGINPIIYNNEKYIDPSDYKLKDYDGHPDMTETIQMYVPISGKDEEGNLQFESNGELVTIAGSANVDWNMVISDIEDTRIDWPRTKLLKSTGLTSAETKTVKYGVALTPMVFLGKQMGEFHLDGIDGHVSEETSTLLFYDIETDLAGNPILARMILTIGLNYFLFEEGGTLDTQSFSGPIEETSYFYQGLVENAVYYVGISQNVTKGYEIIGLSIDGYQGIASYDKVPKIIIGQEQNNEDMIIARVSELIIKKQK